MSFLTHLEWRYATKSFDEDKKIDQKILQQILDSIRLTPTSFGMQAYHVFIVQNKDLQSKMQACSWNQPQVGTASHVLVFCARNDLMEAKNEYFDMMSGNNNEKRKSLEGFEKMVEGFIIKKGDTAIAWSEKQTYIALGFAMAACAELEVDSCPMEGFDAEAIQTILSLPQNLTPTLLLPIGYRPHSSELRPKIRFDEKDLFTTV